MYILTSLRELTLRWLSHARATQRERRQIHRELESRGNLGHLKDSTKDKPMEAVIYMRVFIQYLSVKFTCNGHWDAHLKDLVISGKRKLNSLLRILCNPSLSLYLRRQVILSILSPSLEYGNEVWRCTSTQSKALDAVLLGACKKS